MNDLEKSVDKLIACYQHTVLEKLAIEVTAMGALSLIDWRYGVAMLVFVLFVNLLSEYLLRRKHG